MATVLYRSVMDWNAKEGDEERIRLAHKVWDGTPWIVDVYVGRESKSDRREREMMIWCRDQFGPDAWPIHGKPGAWHRGCATVNGWTWYGFDTEAKMQMFVAAWPTPDGIPLPE